jgi:hypothetical protein
MDATCAARETWSRLRDGFLAVPRATRARFAWTLTAGWIVGGAAVLATTLLLRGELLTLVLGFTALARVVLSAHWPSDMLAGALVGTYWLGVVVFALRRAGRHV